MRTMTTRSTRLLGVVALLVVGAVMLLGAALVAVAAAPAAPTDTWTDTFSDPVLNARWSWIREDPTRWSLTERPGYMRIRTTQTFTTVDNLLVQDAPAGYYEIRTEVLFAPTENFQLAGLLIYLDDDNYLTLGRAYCDVVPPNCVGNGIYFDHVAGGNLVGSNYAMTTPDLDRAYLKIVRQGSVYVAYVSNDFGLTWTLVGAHVLEWMPTKIGLRASNQAQGASEINADFAFFTVTDDVPCCDLDGDGIITVVDIQRVARWWGYAVP